MLTSTNSTCPSLEFLAAFVEGGLPEKERAGVLQHLDTCMDCRALYVEAARMQEELGATGLAEETGGRLELVRVKPGPVPAAGLMPVRALRRRLLIPSLAAAVLAVSLATWIFRGSASPPASQSKVLVAALQSPPARLLPFIERPEAWRGGVPRRPPERDRALFLLGMRLTDLMLAARGTDRALVEGLSREVCELVRAVAAQSAAPHCKLVDELARGGPPLSGAALDHLERGLALEEPLLSLGRFTEAARLAAVSSDMVFFADSDVRRFPGWARDQDSAQLPRKAAEALAEVEALLQDGISTTDMKRLISLLDEIRIECG